MKKNIFLSLLIIFLQAFHCIAVFHLDKSKKHTVCIVVPAYNEEKRIARTLETYAEYFKKIPYLKVDFLVVANNCNDDTVGVSKKVQKKHNEVKILHLIPGGKGFAVKEGFKKALKKNYELIGFVDADMATKPQYFHDLIIKMDNYDGAIASRYCKGATVVGGRPFLRKASGKIFNWVIQKRFNFDFKDTQCGAKIFTHDTIKLITPDMVENKWYFDIEMLYLCTINHKKIIEVATYWEDQPGTHLTINKSLINEFISGQGRVLKRHKKKAEKYFKEKREEKRKKRRKKKLSKKEKRKQAKAKRAKLRAAQKAKKEAARAERKRKRREKKAKQNRSKSWFSIKL